RLRSDAVRTYGANEFNMYAEDDWTVSDRLRVNAGLHGSLFAIDGRTRGGVSPRLSVSYRPTADVAVKAAYSRTVQYVHQLAQSYLALPTDRWIPITGEFRPQTADKVAVGAYWQFGVGAYAMSAEGYYKVMRNIIDYCDEYYLMPPLEAWNARLTSGSGTAKGIDFKIEKTVGRLTGHICYSLAWADRKFREKNGGKRFPAQFDNRHSVKIALSWDASRKVSINAAWIGHSGNRVTLMPQSWESPNFGYLGYMGDGVPLKTSVNNYELPFYHRLDLSCSVRNRRGYWTFGLYNAYCHLNTIAIRRGQRYVTEVTDGEVWTYSKPVFQKVKFIPIIPSISYTWQF
ncbi:MAG: TonB-dependent receptor, partial [Muribaculaceae bacterium]|nr:TonB-dependent receptor [Muribaculaceae bacterium]